MPAAKRTSIIVIAGPTASGKTAAALELARKLDGEIVGADSVQVYRHFNIGTGKATPEELAGIKHHLIDVLDPDEAIDAARFAELADRAIESIAASNRVPIVVGGTGLWTRALLRGLVELPLPDPAIRAKLEQEADHKGSAALYARLCEVDPVAAAKLHANDRLRIVRALEVYEQTGIALGEHQRKHALGGPRYNVCYAFIDPETDDLRERIRTRIAAMLAAGWVDEVKRLLEFVPKTARAFGSVGYRQILENLETQASEAKLEEMIFFATWTYARQQRNWFRGDPLVTHHTHDAREACRALDAQYKSL